MTRSAGIPFRRMPPRYGCSSVLEADRALSGVRVVTRADGAPGDSCALTLGNR